MSESMRWLAKVAATIAAGAGVALFAVPAAHAAGPAITVSPASGLSNGQSVTVSGTGFPAGIQVGAVECSDGTWPNVICDGADAAGTTTAADGSFTVTLPARSAFDGVGQPGGHVDCASSGCAIRAGNSDSTVVADPVAISFG